LQLAHDTVFPRYVLWRVHYPLLPVQQLTEVIHHPYPGYPLLYPRLFSTHLRVTQYNWR